MMNKKYKRIGIKISPDFILRTLKNQDGYGNYKDIIITDVTREGDSIYIDTVLINEDINNSSQGHCDSYIVI